MNSFLFELCAGSFEAALAAECGGANQVELCTNLQIGGVSPSSPLISNTIRALSIPVYVLVRPRGGNFVFTAAEFGQMKVQIEYAKRAGARGVVTGVLLPDCRVDVERSRLLVELARPMTVTFHRAFDETPDLSEGLEAVIRTGADCLLTSGGAACVLEGAETIARLRIQAGQRIRVMAGGGLRLSTLVEVLRRSGVSSLHGSLIRRGDGQTPHYDPPILEDDVREAVRLMGEKFATLQSRAPIVL